jgi:hypothetical protein
VGGTSMPHWAEAGQGNGEVVNATTGRACAIMMANMPAGWQPSNGPADKHCRAPHGPLARAVPPAHLGGTSRTSRLARP